METDTNYASRPKNSIPESIFNKEQDPRILIALEFIRNRIEENEEEDNIRLKIGSEEEPEMENEETN